MIELTCYKPLHALYSSSVNAKSGKRSLVFISPSDPAFNSPDVMMIPCGQCIGCRLENSRQWAVRCCLENELHDDSIFLTLTYDNEHLPEDGSLRPDDLSGFIKRLRRRLEYEGYNKKIRFFACGEYGSDYNRPHYHAIIFGWRPRDSKRYRKDLFTSAFIESVWQKGWCPFGSVTFDSAAYVARYITKKITGDLADDFYNGRVPEFVRMSRRPGIGFNWFEKHQSDILRDDYIVVRDGLKVGLPKYFNRLIESYYPDLYKELKERHKCEAADKQLKDCIDRGYEPRETDWHSFAAMERDFYEYHVLPDKQANTEGKLNLKKRGFEDGSM